MLLDEKNGTIVIKRSAFNFYNTPEVGEHTLTIYAGEKYKKVDIILTITQEEINEEPEIVGEAVVGQDLTLSLAKAAVENFQSVSLQKKDGKVKRILNKSEGGDSGNDYYVLDEGNNQLIIKAGRFKEAGEYTVYVKIAGQNKTLNTTFQVKEKSDTPEEHKEESDTLAVPEGASLEYVSSDRTYLIGFGGEHSEEIKKYLTNITSVFVNSVSYEKASIDNFKWLIGRYALMDSDGGDKELNEIALSGPSNGANKIKVVVKAKGYEDLSLTYPNSAE